MIHGATEWMGFRSVIFNFAVLNVVLSVVSWYPSYTDLLFGSLFIIAPVYLGLEFMMMRKQRQPVDKYDASVFAVMLMITYYTVGLMAVRFWKKDMVLPFGFITAILAILSVGGIIINGWLSRDAHIDKSVSMFGLLLIFCGEGFWLVGANDPRMNLEWVGSPMFVAGVLTMLFTAFYGTRLANWNTNRK
jgi:hypothetical protein